MAALTARSRRLDAIPTSALVGAPHQLGKRIGAWPAVLAVTAAVAGAAAAADARR